MSLRHILSFGYLLCIAKNKKQVLDTKFDLKAEMTAYVGYGYLEGQQCVKGYPVDLKNKGVSNRHTHTHASFITKG